MKTIFSIKELDELLLLVIRTEHNVQTSDIIKFDSRGGLRDFIENETVKAGEDMYTFTFFPCNFMTKTELDSFELEDN